MAFKEAGDSTAGGPDTPGPLGLPLRWDALRERACPRCQEPLEEFAHAARWACVCGFKISAARLKEIVDAMRPGYGKRHKEPEDGWGRFGDAGYRIGQEKFNDETPF